MIAKAGGADAAKAEGDQPDVEMPERADESTVKEEAEVGEQGGDQPEVKKEEEEAAKKKRQEEEAKEKSTHQISLATPRASWTPCCSPCCFWSATSSTNCHFRHRPHANHASCVCYASHPAKVHRRKR